LLFVTQITREPIFYRVSTFGERELVLEHPLTLPAFEILAPFVQSGQLWISANDSDNLPQDYLLQKVEQLDAFFGRGYLKKIKAVVEIKERWLRIIPADWKIRRNADEQTACVLKNIDEYLSSFKDNKFKQLHSLCDFVQRMRADNNFNKEEILARIGKLRGLLHPALLSEMATLIQIEFVRSGAHFNQNAIIYPGNSAQCLTNPHFEPLRFDHLTLRQVKRVVRK